MVLAGAFEVVVEVRIFPRHNITDNTGIARNLKSVASSSVCLLYESCSTLTILMGFSTHLVYLGIAPELRTEEKPRLQLLRFHIVTE